MGDNTAVATNKKSPQGTTKATTNVTRITATDDVKQAVTSKIASKKAPKKATASSKTNKPNAFKAFLGYFVGAWVELKQVNWPTRKATWSLTLAVLAFTAFFIILIVILDAGFKLLFERILG
ncbi:preprotein translocase subunit SecE [compost metagenome]